MLSDGSGDEEEVLEPDVRGLWEDGSKEKATKRLFKYRYSRLQEQKMDAARARHRDQVGDVM